MNAFTKVLSEREEEIDDRLDPSRLPDTDTPVLGAGNLVYEISTRVKAVVAGGIGLVEQLVEAVGLRRAIDERLDVLKVHLPYHESDHVLTMAYNLLAGGQCIEDIGSLRRDMSFLDAVGAQRLPGPSTSGDFLRRLGPSDIEDLMEAQNDARLRVWREQNSRFRKQAIIDVDGTIVATTGEKKEGADFAYNGKYGYGPLLVTLANTGEVLYAVNRSANRPSHDGCVRWLDRAVELAWAGRFKKVLLRGDTDFALTRHFDRWTTDEVQFVFSMDASPTFKQRAAALEESKWTVLERPAKYQVKTAPRRKRPNHKDIVVKARGMKNLRLVGEAWAEMEYRPGKAEGTYRLIVVRKNISVENGDDGLFDEIRYYFFVTNVPVAEMSATEVIFHSNARCNQENIIDQLKHGVPAMRMPAGSLVANWAYMVIAILAWNIKQWLALMLPKRAGAAQLATMEFRTFLNNVMLVPAQIMKGARRITFRLLSYNKWVRLLLEGSLRLRRMST